MNAFTTINSLGATVVSRDHDERESKLSNALVHQKDTILAELYKADDADSIAKVVDLVEFVAPVWKCCGYAYKTREILDQIVNRCYHFRGQAQDVLASMRKNAKGRQGWVNEVSRLNDLIGRVCLLRQ